jgi:hypothetical protein
MYQKEKIKINKKNENKKIKFQKRENKKKENI